MIGKRLLTISLALPFMPISGVASASHNDQHRPNQPGVYSSPYEAFAMERRALPRRAPQVRASRSCTYQGGPKSGSWACR